MARMDTTAKTGPRVSEFIKVKVAPDPCNHYVCMYLFKEYARTATTEAKANEILMRMFVFKVLCTSNYK